MPRPSQPASWVIRDNRTGRAVCEVFDKRDADAVACSTRYTAVPILEWLVSLNRPQLTEAARHAP